MKLTTANTILEATFGSLNGANEKLALELMLEASGRNTVGRRIVADLLTNDFDADNSGYMFSNIDSGVYTSNELCTLAKLWDKACDDEAKKAPARPETAIERTERAIANGQIKALAYRVYELTTSPTHLLAGADFFLVESFDTEADAEQCKAQRMERGLAVCVVVHDAVHCF